MKSPAVQAGTDRVCPGRTNSGLAKASTPLRLHPFTLLAYKLPESKKWRMRQGGGSRQFRGFRRGFARASEKHFTRRLYSIPVKLHNQKNGNESFRAGNSPMPLRLVCSLNNNFQDYLADGYRFCGRIAAGGVRLMRPDDHKVAGSHVYSRTTAIVESDVFLPTEFDSHGHA